MKHIGFDESTVMNEYARIVNDSGFIKAAGEIEFGMPLITPQPAQVSPDQFAKGVVSSVFGLNTAEPPTKQSAELLPEVLNKYREWISRTIVPQVKASPGAADRRASAEFHAQVRAAIQNILMNWYGANKLPAAQIEVAFTIPAKQSYDMALGEHLPDAQNANDANPLVQHMNRLNGIHANLMKQHKSDQNKVRPAYEQEVTKTVQQLKKQFGDHPEIPKFEAEAKKIGLPHTASTKNSSLSKRAKGDGLYDVSGETGEQLIDSAHPGNAKTEVSCKTDENLVETIFEQQARDIEVTHKMPKGTYARLVALNDGLVRLGCTKQAESLKGLLKSLGGHSKSDLALLMLGNKLSDLGHKKASEKVKELFLLKKALGTPESVSAALSQVSKNVSEVVSAMNSLGLGSNKEFSAVLEELRTDLGSLGTIVPDKMDRKTLDWIKNMLNGVLANLGNAQSVVASSEGKPGIPRDIATVSKAIGTAISTAMFANSSVDTLLTASPADGAPEATPEAKKPSFLSKLFSDEKFANDWANRFNAQINELITKANIPADQVPDEVKSLVAKTGAGWNELKGSLKNIVNTWRSKGKWNDFMAYLNDTLAKSSSSVAGVEPAKTIKPEDTRILGDGSPEDKRKYNEAVHQIAKELTKWSYYNSEELTGTALRGSGITPEKAREWRDKFYEDAFNFVRSTSPYVNGVTFPRLGAQHFKQDFAAELQKKYKK